ncbi:MAG: hypothetical protein ACD_23C01183G0002 [uncultured bacterium]|nr:MAG: hypothetical protein ACD_23C01183G0002 [uncultured bacterium]
MGVANAGLDGGFVKVQAGKIARIGGIAKAQVDAICAVVHCGLERRQAAGRAHQFQSCRRSCAWPRLMRGISNCSHKYSKKYRQGAGKVKPQSVTTFVNLVNDVGQLIGIKPDIQPDTQKSTVARYN